MKEERQKLQTEAKCIKQKVLQQTRTSGALKNAIELEKRSNTSLKAVIEKLESAQHALTLNLLTKQQILTK